MAQAKRPRARLSKLAGDGELRVRRGTLAKRWSPQQVCQALKKRLRRVLPASGPRNDLPYAFQPEHPARSVGLRPAVAFRKVQRLPRSSTKVKPPNFIGGALKMGGPYPKRPSAKLIGTPLCRQNI